MTKSILTIVLALALAAPASADVTIKSMVTSKGMGMSGSIASTTYIKGNRMRSDTDLGDRVQSMIFDVDTQKLYMFDSKKKEADVYDMATFGQEMSKSVDLANMKMSFKPNGQTKEIDGKSAIGYDMEFTLPTTMPGSKDMSMTLTMSGPVWIVKGAPGTEEYARFYKSAVDKGWIFSDPRAAKGQPGQAKAMAEMYKQLAEAGGIAYETDSQMKISGDGPMAGLFAKMGNVSINTKVTAVAADPLTDDLFALPAGYKLNSKKN